MSNAKLDALLETVEEILDEDPRHKVVVFSLLQADAGDDRAGSSPRPRRPWVTTITGDVTRPGAGQAHRRFNTDPACRVFLSSDAGAYGVDLNQGSHLICYDLPWSARGPGPACARIDRTNSAFDQIHIVYMYGQDTIEERMFNMLLQKAKVARAFIDGEFDARCGTLKLDLESLREFLDAG